MLALFSLTSPPFIRSLLHLEELPFRSLVRVVLSLFTPLLFVAPAVLLWAQDGVSRLRGLGRSQLYEATALMILLVGVGLLAVSAPPGVYRTRGLMLWVFAPLLWAAARFGPLGASTALLTIAALSVWGASRQLGPFVNATNADQVLSLQLFWIALSLPVMRTGTGRESAAGSA
jgi:integral membrane sensor domain MASE1